MKVLAISGSLTQGSRTHAAVSVALQGAAQEAGVKTALLDLRGRDLQFCDGRPVEQYNADTQEAIALVEGAECLIIGTPMYRATYSGALKNLFDLVRNEPMAGKVAGLLATGGSDHHFLAIEYGLRPLCGFFSMFTVPGGVYVHNAHYANGAFVDEGVRTSLLELGRQSVRLWRQVHGLEVLPYPLIRRKPGQEPGTVS